MDYALEVHENPDGHRFRQTNDPENPSPAPAEYPGPKISKYLETPADMMKVAFGDKIREAEETAIREALSAIKVTTPTFNAAPRLRKKS